MIFLAAGLALLLSYVSSGLQDFDIADLKKQFDYDESIPLTIERELTEENGSWRVYKMSFSGPRGVRVPCFLVEPKAEGRHPALVFGHWGLGTMAQYLPEAKLYAEAGAVSLLFEYPWYPVGNSPRQHSGYTRAEDDLDLYIHGVVDIRRAIDLLRDEPSVDPNRIAYVGHSIGAQLGAILSAVDDRVKAVVLIGGVPSLESMLLDESVDYLKGYRNAFGAENIKKYIDVNRRLDAIVYVPHADPVSIREIRTVLLHRLHAKIL
jgi:cephalosporin-C deacetylase-like acetyl esterase